MNQRKNTSSNEDSDSLVWNESAQIIFEALKTGDFGSNTSTSRYLQTFSSTGPWKKSYSKGCGTTHFRPMESQCTRPVQAIRPCIIRLVNLSKSCGSYQDSSERSREVNSGSASYPFIHPMHLRLFSKEHKNPGCLMHVWNSSRSYFWTILESGLETPLASILLPSCQMMTHRCSSVTVWGNKHDERDQTRHNGNPHISCKILMQCSRWKGNLH